MRIGVSLPLGAPGPEDADLRSVGTDVANAVCLARQRLGARCELLMRDNQNSPSKAAEIAAEFAAAGVAGVLGLPTSDEVHRTAPVLEEAGIAAITSMATSPALSRYPLVFRTRTSDRHSCRKLLQHIQAAGYRRIGSLSEDTAYAADCTRALVEMGKAAGIHFSGSSFLTHAKDLSAEVNILRSRQIDAVFISTQDEEGFARVLRQVRQGMGGIPVLGAAMPGSRKFLEMAGALACGIVYVCEPIPEEALTPCGREFLNEFRRAYGEPQTGPYAVASTFASFFALQAAHAAGGEIAERLSQLIFHDPVNGPFRFEANEIASALGMGEENRFADRRLKRIG